MDQQYQSNDYKFYGREHAYGENVHILNSPMAQTLLAKVSRQDCRPPELFHLVRRIYSMLLDQALNLYFPKEQISWPTRMAQFTPKGVFQGPILSTKQPVVTVDIARAGILPSQLVMEELSYAIPDENIRQDHFYMARISDNTGKVTGVDVSGSKIGGGQDNALVFFPDPMAATGSSLSYAVSYYKKNVPGKAFKYIALHLIITPEYLKRMKADHPDMAIFAARLDRGLSSDKVLSSVPGSFWNDEKGLNEHSYIVPGAGGVGEVLNNSFV